MLIRRLAVLILFGGSWLSGINPDLQAADVQTPEDQLKSLIRNHPGSVEARAAEFVLERLEFEKLQAAELRGFDLLQEAGDDPEKLKTSFFLESGESKELKLKTEFEGTMVGREAAARLAEIKRKFRDQQIEEERNAYAERKQKALDEAFEKLKKLEPSSPLVAEFIKVRTIILQNRLTKEAEKEAEDKAQAAKSLEAALRAPLQYDQRWRRLSEVARDYPNTDEARDAKSRLQTRLNSIAPIRIENRTSVNLVFEYEEPYSRWKPYVIRPGKVGEISTAIQISIVAETRLGTVRVVIPAGLVVAFTDADDGKSYVFKRLDSDPKLRGLR